jgi:hypothetical protein
MAPQADRGCIFFNFGAVYVLRMLVAMHSLRKFYAGPISVFITEDEFSAEVKTDIARLDASAIPIRYLSKSYDRHRMLLASPYRATLSFDSDLVFCSGIDPLWPALERMGVLVTRFYPPPYGSQGTPEKPSGRVGLINGIRHLISDETYARAIQRVTTDQQDVNIGVLGIARPAGNRFLRDYATHMEEGRKGPVALLDEMLVVALLSRHPHCLAEEFWNCPADEFFRRTNLRDARIIHYFGEGSSYRSMVFGRNRNTWAGKIWFDAFESAARDLPLDKWLARDTFLAQSPEP